MTQDTAEKQKGLEGVIAGNTSASRVDGVNGRLIYRGYEIQDLAEHASFEEVAYLIWNGDLPTRTQLNKFNQVLAKNRVLPKEIISLIRSFPKKAVPMDVLRTAVSALPIYDPDVRNNSPEANQRKAVRLLARCPSIVSTFDRCRRGKKPVAPDKKLSIAGNLLYMMTGKKPDPVSTRALDTYLVLLADHGFNASTFTSRVVVSTL